MSVGTQDWVLARRSAFHDHRAGPNGALHQCAIGDRQGSQPRGRWTAWIHVPMSRLSAQVLETIWAELRYSHTNQTMKDLVGQMFGRWTVVSYSGPGPNWTHNWNCRCTCGSTAVIRGSSLASGNSTSCGCLQADVTRARSLKHGAVKQIDGKRVFTPEYKVWQRMKERCYNETCKSYARYGGRGIQICSRWRHSFANFLADMGHRPPGASIERCDNNGSYTPGNCVWADVRAQANNKRNNVRITHTGKTQTVAQWALEFGLKRATLAYRLRSGWDIHKAMNTIKKKWRGQ